MRPPKRTATHRLALVGHGSCCRCWCGACACLGHSMAGTGRCDAGERLTASPRLSLLPACTHPPGIGCTEIPGLTPRGGPSGTAACIACGGGHLCRSSMLRCGHSPTSLLWLAARAPVCCILAFCSPLLACRFHRSRQACGLSCPRCCIRQAACQALLCNGAVLAGALGAGEVRCCPLGCIHSRAAGPLLHVCHSAHARHVSCCGVQMAHPSCRATCHVRGLGMNACRSRGCRRWRDVGFCPLAY